MMAVFLLVISVIAGAAILKYVDPATARIWHLAIFYAALFGAVSSLAKGMGFNFRRAILLALLAVTALIFQTASILTLWNAILILAVFILIELYGFHASR